jgi:hypothetical protein
MNAVTVSIRIRRVEGVMYVLIERDGHGDDGVEQVVGQLIDGFRDGFRAMPQAVKLFDRKDHEEEQS